VEAEMPTDDPYNLQRFVEVQEPWLDQVRSELKGGQKREHWMWFIFPQIAGLGKSETSRVYAISSRNEARAFLEHPFLGSNLRECTRLVCNVNGRSAEQIFGWPDDKKFQSSMTLFACATEDNHLFRDALRKYYSGRPDGLTLKKLRLSSIPEP
jgi:uncharacterized protein (DUF1810 family)